MKRAKIPSGLIVQYVGNRLHVMFHLPGALYSIRDKLLEYLEKHCAITSGMRIALVKDFRCPEIIHELKILGLFGKLHGTMDDIFLWKPAEPGTFANSSIYEDMHGESQAL